jgi:hypothetical protein
LLLAENILKEKELVADVCGLFILKDISESLQIHLPMKYS